MNDNEHLNKDRLISRNKLLFFIMKKWADYLISEVAYDSENLVSIATGHQDTDQGVTKGKPIDRLRIASDIKNGLSYITIYNGKNSWKKGHKIQTFSIEGNPYIRIDKNKVKLDYLGDLPESLFQKLNPFSEPEPAQPSSPKGSLPKESAEELPQELDLVPEPEPEPAQPSSPKGSLPKESAEELPQELDLVPEPEPEPAQPSSPKGSLPKESAEELPQELDLVPEPENRYQEFTQLNDLHHQIDELKNMLSDELLPKSQFEEEHDVDEFFKIGELVKDVEKSEQNEIEHEIIQTLRQQNKKLDDIEKKLHDSKK